MGARSCLPVGNLTDMTNHAAADRNAIDAISDQFVVELCAASPMTAVWHGSQQPGDHRLDDLSPDGLAEMNGLAKRTHAEVASAIASRDSGPGGDVNGGDTDSAASNGATLSAEIISERLELAMDQFESGWAHADLNVIASPLQQVRMIFDLLPQTSADDWQAIAGRMRSVPEALAGFRQSLQYAADRGQVVAARQITKCAEQCGTYAGTASKPGFFRSLADQAGGLGDQALADAAAAADAAYGELGAFLTGELWSRAPSKDAVGEQRYLLASRDFLGEAVDLAETYQWGWHEFLDLEAEMRTVAERIAPGAGSKGAAEQLDADPTYRIEGTGALQEWMQKLSDAAIDALGRTHFDIAEPLRTLECRIAPPGGGVGAYYTGPSNDFARPGRMWFSVEPGRESFAIWRDITTVYHEGVPGHHLQIATAVHQRDTLNDFRRSLAGTSGHAEGWALYAERLMRELGYLDDDAALLGMLDGQLFRAARVIIDIGMHLEFVIPAGTGFHEGERWTPELGLEFLLTRTITDPAHCRDEIDRYLGWPGQAPAYKVGERVWREGRDAVAATHGSAFDVKEFHTVALNMGGMGLGALRRQLGMFAR